MPGNRRYGYWDPLCLLLLLLQENHGRSVGCCLLLLLLLHDECCCCCGLLLLLLHGMLVPSPQMIIGVVPCWYRSPCVGHQSMLLLLILVHFPQVLDWLTRQLGLLLEVSDLMGQ